MSPKARMTDLSDLLSKNQPETPTPGPAVPPAEKSEPAKSQRKPAAPKPATKTSAPAAAPPAGVPRYLTLVRKELRITEDQADHIGRTARSLNLARQGQGERITDNTLVRLGISLLIDRLGDLHGTTEAELYESLGLSYEG